MEAVDLKLAASVATEISYFDGEMLGKANSPAGVALAVYAALPEGSVSVTVAPETGLPAASRSTPLQEAGKGAAAVHSDRKMRAAAPSRRIEERMTEELYRWRRTFFRSLRAVKGATSVIVDVNISDKVGGVKYFLSVLIRALRRARHFALVENVPIQPRLARNQFQVRNSVRPMISSVTTSIMIVNSNSPVTRNLGKHSRCSSSRMLVWTGPLG